MEVQDTGLDLVIWQLRYELRWLAPLVLAGSLGGHRQLGQLRVERYQIESK